MSCIKCGAPVVLKSNKPSLQERFCSWLKVGVIVSAVMTVASLFTDFTPSFIKCAVATLVLGLARSSAGQMVERH
jgi:hypothetical protein